ncbi:MAG TPA: hypothetical protein VGY66_16725, partial [Gemmataceae bacterium]|nr:hypothetical protein [Gemmataceae bacterium]
MTTQGKECPAHVTLSPVQADLLCDKSIAFFAKVPSAEAKRLEDRGWKDSLDLVSTNRHCVFLHPIARHGPMQDTGALAREVKNVWPVHAFCVRGVAGYSPSP